MDGVLSDILRQNMLSSSQINQSGALAEWLTRCPAMLQDRVDRQFLRERGESKQLNPIINPLLTVTIVFESHRRSVPSTSDRSILHLTFTSRENSIPQFFYHFDGHPQGVAQRRCASLMS